MHAPLAQRAQAHASCWHMQKAAGADLRIGSRPAAARAAAAAAAARDGQQPPASIRQFIASECPLPGLDGQLREQPAPMGAELLTCVVLQLSPDALLVPGQRQLVTISQPQLDHIIADGGQVALACMEAGSPPRLCGPKRGSWAVAGRVCGVQRLPGSNSRALVRLLVTDRIAVQALKACDAAAGGGELVLARAAAFRDRWACFVRRSALDDHLAGSSTAAGRDVLSAVQQVHDVASELLSLLRELAASVAETVERGPAAGGGVGQLLEAHEAADELEDLLAWCEMGEGSSSGGTIPADGQLMERAWRLSFAPCAASGLAAALGIEQGSSSSSSVREMLEMTDLGQRLEAAVEAAEHMRARLAARLSLERL